MSYTVRWTRVAEAQLTAEWIRATNREAIAGYAEQIERILQRNPVEQGESRDHGYRLWFHRPLAAFYHVDEAAKTVRVAALKWSGR